MFTEASRSLDVPLNSESRSGLMRKCVVGGVAENDLENGGDDED